MSEFSQQSDRRGQVRRNLSFAFTPLNRTDVYGAGSTLPMNFKDLWSRINRRQRAIYIPRWLDEMGNVSSSVIAAAAVFGIAKQPPGLTGLGAGLFDPSEILVDEIPIPV